MTRFLSFVLALVLGVALSAFTPDVEAKRLGSSKSFGMQRSTPTKQMDAPTPSRQTTATPQAAPQKRSWMGPIAGLAAGLGLAALMSHLGMGEEFANFLMIALLAMVAFLAFRWFMAKRNPAPAMQYAGAGAGAGGNVSSFPMNGGASAPAPVTQVAETGAFPPGFDAQAFAREAKVNFIRLQAAYDAGNLDDLRAFTSPEVFAELSMQLAERTGPATPTDVVGLDARVIEAVDEAGQHVVSVRFTGQISEDGAAPAALDEIWHLAKPMQGSGGWVIAGIQQA